MSALNREGDILNILQQKKKSTHSAENSLSNDDLNFIILKIIISKQLSLKNSITIFKRESYFPSAGKLVLKKEKTDTKYFGSAECGGCSLANMC